MSATRRRVSSSRAVRARQVRRKRPRSRLPFKATLGLGILASLSTLQMVLFRRAKRRLGF